MQITKTHSEGIAALTVQGQLDGTTSPQLESELLGLVQAGSPRLVLDLAQVPLVSSAALRVLLSAAKRMKKQGGHIHLCALRPEVKQVFDISGLTAFFGIHADLAAALAAAKDAPAAPPTPAAPEAAPARPIPAVPVASSSPATPGLPETESAKPAPVAPPPIAPPPPVPPEPPPTPVDPPGAKAVPPPPTPPEPDPAATLVFAARPKPSSDPMATVIFSSRHAPAEAQPAATEPPHLAFSEAAAAVEPPPAAPALPPTAETPPPAPVAASPLPAAPGTPSTVVPPTPPAPPPEHAAPPVIPPAAGTPPAATPLPVTPLRRTSPAVVAKAAEMRGDPPPAIPSAAPVQIQRHEPRPPVPATPARPLLPIMAAVFTALAILAGVGICLRLLNTEEPRKPDRPASPSPTATPRGEDTPIVTPSVEPSPTAAPVVIRPSPSPTASPTPAPTAVPTATPTIAPTSPAPTPVPTPVPTPTPASTPVPTPSPASTPTETIISPAGAIDTNRASPENQAVRQAVLQRIDAMPLSQADKARLYMALERARGLGKLVTINFATGRTDIAPNDVVNLDSTVHRPKVQRFLDDPAVVLVVLGFSDTKGSDKANKDISDRRARRVVEALRGSCNVTNLIHSIGMGGQTLAGETLEKNRAVEVWAVLP